MSTQSGTRWYRSLSFKLTAYVSAVVVACISVSYIIMIRQFEDLTLRQEEESFRTSALTLAGTFTDNLNSLISSATALQKMSEAMSPDEFREAGKSLLSANQAIASIHVLAPSESSETEHLFVRTPIDEPPELEGRKFVSIESALVGSALETIQSERVSGKETTQLLRNLRTQPKIPVIQIAVRGNPKSQSHQFAETGMGKWLVLSVWHTSLSAPLSKYRRVSVVIADTKGQIIFQPDRLKTASLPAPIQSSELELLNRERARSRFWIQTNSHGTRIAQSAVRIADLDLFLIAQRPIILEPDEVRIRAQNLLSAALFLVLLIAGATWLAARTLTSRITRVVDTATGDKKGTDVFAGEMPADDEIGQLSRNLAQALNHNQVSTIHPTLGERQYEFKLTAEMQKILARRNVENHNGILSFGSVRPAENSRGDWWGRFSFGSELEIFVLADPCGTGADAAITTSIAFTFFLTKSENFDSTQPKTPDPAELIRELNAILCESGEGHSTLKLLMAAFEFKSRTLHILNAGHSFPFLMFNNHVEPVISAGNPLGISNILNLRAISVDLLENMKLFLFSDGLLRCRNQRGHRIKKKPLKKAFLRWNLLPCETIWQNISKLIANHIGTSYPKDDVVSVVVEFVGNQPHNQLRPTEEKPIAASSLPVNPQQQKDDHSPAEPPAPPPPPIVRKQGSL